MFECGCVGMSSPTDIIQNNINIAIIGKMCIYAREKEVPWSRAKIGRL